MDVVDVFLVKGLEGLDALKKIHFQKQNTWMLAVDLCENFLPQSCEMFQENRVSRG